VLHHLHRPQRDWKHTRRKIGYQGCQMVCFQTKNPNLG
jgi:hypothetical protein